MSQISNVNLSTAQNISIAGYRDRVIASGVALLAVYAVIIISYRSTLYSKH